MLLLQADALLPEIELSAVDRMEIETLQHADASRLIHGKLVPKPVEPVTKESHPLPPSILQLLTEFADVFPESLPLGLPPQRSFEHETDLEPGSRPPHIVCIVCPQQRTSNYARS